MNLLKSTIFKDTEKIEIFRNIDLNLWIKFIKWSYFFICPNYIKKFYRHCYTLWTGISHAYEKEHSINNEITEEKKQIKFVEKPIKNIQNNVNLKGFDYIFKPQHFINAFGKIIVDLFELILIVAKNANIIVDYYYRDTLKNHSH